MHNRKSAVCFWALCIAHCALTGCSDDEVKPYPSLVTEMVDIWSDKGGVLRVFATDGGDTLRITNPQSGYKANGRYRAVAGYTLEGKDNATLYSLEGARFLRDSTSVARHDPTGVVAVWRVGRYVNLHLAPKTQGGTHYWGFAVDSVVGRTHHISLHHRQNGDPLSYSATVYASLAVDSIHGAQPGDEIALHIRTFNSAVPAVWRVVR